MPDQNWCIHFPCFNIIKVIQIHIAPTNEPPNCISAQDWVLGRRNTFFYPKSAFDHPLNKAENWHFASATALVRTISKRKKQAALSAKRVFFYINICLCRELGRTRKVAREAEMEACPLSIRANLWRRMNSPIDQCVPPLSGGRVLLLFIGFNANIHHRPYSMCSQGHISAISQTVPHH